MDEVVKTAQLTPQHQSVMEAFHEGYMVFLKAHLLKSKEQYIPLAIKFPVTIAVKDASHLDNGEIAEILFSQYFGGSKHSVIYKVFDDLSTDFKAEGYTRKQCVDMSDSLVSMVVTSASLGEDISYVMYTKEGQLMKVGHESGYLEEIDVSPIWKK